MKKNVALSKIPIEKLPEYSETLELSVELDKKSNITMNYIHNLPRIRLHTEDMKKLRLECGDAIIGTIKGEDNSEGNVAIFEVWISKVIDQNTSKISQTMINLLQINLSDSPKIIIRKMINISNEDINEITIKSLNESNSKIPDLPLWLNIPLFQNAIYNFSIDGVVEAYKVIKIDNYPSYINTKTKINLFDNNATKDKPKILFGGYIPILKEIRDLVEFTLNSSNLFISPPKGLLIYGPPGTGKTQIIRVLRSELTYPMYTITSSDYISQYVGESEAKLKSLFTTAINNSPSLIFIDEIDGICSDRRKNDNEFDIRLIGTLLALLDGIHEKGRIFIIATTNRPNALDPALRRPGRLDREIEISVPTESQRKEIIDLYIDELKLKIREEDRSIMYQNSQGYVGSDIKSVMSELYLKQLGSETTDFIDGGVINNILKKTVPSSLREVSIEIPEVHYSQIGGQENVKQQIKESVELPLTHPELFRKMGILPPKGILLYGPPGKSKNNRKGCSKTLLAKALATETKMNFIAVQGPELTSKWVGESEKAIREVFRKAYGASPCVLFFDEIDSIAVKRGNESRNVNDRILSQFLVEMDGISIQKQIVVIAATNRPDVLDPALLRPGRLDRLIYVGLPDLAARKEILKIHNKKRKLKDIGEKELEELSGKLEGYTGAEIEYICREAALVCFDRSKGLDTEVCISDFRKSIERIKPQVKKETLDFYKNFGGRCVV